MSRKSIAAADVPPLPQTGGVKHDSGKPRWDLLPYAALTRVVEIFTLGADKYGARNWEQGFDYSRVYAAAQRHLTAWWQGEDNDWETSLSHLAHAACNILFLLHFKVTQTGNDDRPRYK